MTAGGHRGAESHAPASDHGSPVQEANGVERRDPSLPEITGVSSAARWGCALAGLLVIAFLGVYLPDAGRGFVKDDVVWIATSRVLTPSDWGRLLDAPTGFFRPVVSASFALDYFLFGLEPRGYGLTNVLLACACAVAVAWLLRTLGAPLAVAAGGAFVWAFNFHGINMAVFWLSGRTALWLCLWWTVAAAGFAKRAGVWGVMASALAMLSKEEGFMLPVLLAGWAWLEAEGASYRGRAMHVLSRTWPYAVAGAAMLALRARTGAYTPWAAPDFYTYRGALDALVVNAREYADRTLTFAVAVTLLVWFLAGRPRAHAHDSRRVAQGLLWLTLAFVPTILLPSRSSLYALLPSIGAILALSSIVEAWVVQWTPAAARKTTIAVAVLAVVLWPIYRARTVRYIGEARLASAVLAHASDIARDGHAGLVIVRDRRDRRPTAEQALGTLAAEASTLVTDGRIRLWLDPPPREFVAAGDDRPPDLPVVGEIVVSGGAASRTR